MTGSGVERRPFCHPHSLRPLRWEASTSMLRGGCQCHIGSRQADPPLEVALQCPHLVSLLEIRDSMHPLPSESLSLSLALSPSPFPIPCAWSLALGLNLPLETAVTAKLWIYLEPRCQSLDQIGTTVNILLQQSLPMGRQAVLLQAMDAWPLSCPPAQEMCVELHRNVCEHASGFLRRSGSFPKAKENAQANL